MRKLFMFACAAALLSACNSENNKTENTANTDQPAESEWTRLFDGVSTTGWHKYGGGQAGFAWKVADSMKISILNWNGRLRRMAIAVSYSIHMRILQSIRHHGKQGLKCR
jgi:hypothetical protein